MVQTRRSALNSTAEKVKTSRTLALPPLNAKSVTRHQRSGSIGSATGSKGTKQRSRRRSSSFHERPPRDEKKTISSKKGSDTNISSAPKQATPQVSCASPSESAKEHFLKGINLNQCLDILSIPSPPTPRSAERRRQRRLSTSFLTNKVTTTPLQDMTNSGASPLIMNKLNQSDSTSKAERSKKRRSLCHVPSPLDVGGGEPPAKKPSPEMKPPLEPLVLDEEPVDKVGQRKKQKRSKRRQSLVLPTECAESLGIPTATIATDKKTESGDSQRTTDEIEGDPTGPNLTELQKMVRDYCSSTGTGTDTQSRMDCADLIKKTTGYSLCGSSFEGDSVEEASSDPAEIRNKKKAIFLEIGPSVQKMEEKKAALVKEAQRSTGCTVEKTRSGKYRYRDATGTKISADNYSKRYGEWIARQKREKVKTFQVLRQQLEATTEAEMPAQETETLSAKSNEVVFRSVEFGQSDNDDMDCDDTGSIFDRATPQSKECTRPQIDIQMDYSPQRIRPPEIEPGVADCKNEQLVPPQACTDAATSSGVADEAAPTEKVEHASNETEEEDSLLPIPSREEESEDPEIAQAESKLWKSIDEALERYSREVVAIQARRRAEADSKS